MNNNKPWPCLKCFILMDNVDDDHCKCSKCGTEVWYDYDEPPGEDEIESLMQESFNTHKQSPDISLMGGYAVGGGSKSKGRNKKHLMKKPSAFSLYKQLANPSIPIQGKSKKKVDS